jgi:hypothetical protein
VLVQYADDEVVVAGQVSGVGQLDTVAVERTVTVTRGTEEQVDGARPDAGTVSVWEWAGESGLTRRGRGG